MSKVKALIFNCHLQKYPKKDIILALESLVVTQIQISLVVTSSHSWPASATACEHSRSLGPISRLHRLVKWNIADRPMNYCFTYAQYWPLFQEF